MTKKELIEKLQPFPDNMDIFIDERKTEFRFGLLNSIRMEEINLSEEPEGEILAKVKVIILDEE